MKRIKEYIWQRFIGYNSDMTAQIWRCRVRYEDETEGLIQEEREMPGLPYNRNSDSLIETIDD